MELILFVCVSDGADGIVACVVNMAPVVHHDYRIGLPRSGRWAEILNTDAGVYGGSDVGNLGGVTAVEQEWHGRPASAQMVLPPLAAVWLRWEG